MISADEIRQLNELGLSAEQYRAVLSLLSASRDVTLASREKSRLRSRKYRENKGRVTSSSRDNHVASRVTEKGGYSSLLTSSLEDSLKVVKEERSEIVALAKGRFAEFWELYPNKVGKPHAAKSFEKVMRSGRVDFDTLMAGLQLYVNKTDDRPWCNPATWLNQGRWDDQPATVVQTGGINGKEQRKSDFAAAFRKLKDHASRAEPLREGGGTVARLFPHNRG